MAVYVVRIQACMSAECFYKLWAYVLDSSRNLQFTYEFVFIISNTCVLLVKVVSVSK